MNLLTQSQSPQIGAFLQTQMKEIRKQMEKQSQSPQIGAFLQTYIEVLEQEKDLLSLNPLKSGHSFRQYCSKDEKRWVHVSIPSNRGIPSDTKNRSVPSIYLASSQSPQIGAFLQTHAKNLAKHSAWESQSPQIGAFLQTKPKLS